MKKYRYLFMLLLFLYSTSMHGLSGGTSPWLAISSPANGSTVSNPDIDVSFEIGNFTLGESTGFVKYTVNNGLPEYTTKTVVRLRDLPNGIYTIDAELVDANKSSLVPPQTTGISFTLTKYDPSNPVEPEIPITKYRLQLQTSPSGAGNVSGAGEYAAGASPRVSCGYNAGFKFVEWKEGDETVTTNQSFYYTIPERDVTLTAHFEYDPSNPGEPITPVIPIKHRLFLQTDPKDAGSFNISSGNFYEEGSSVYVHAYTATGFKFKEWKKNGEPVSNSQGFNHQIGTEDETLTAVFYYDPSNPGEPNQPTEIKHGLTSLTHEVEKGQTVAFPVYLMNLNIDVNAVEFKIEFPLDAIIDNENIILSDRRNGHRLNVAKEENVYHITVSSDDNSNFFDSNGILLFIPVTIPNSWTAGETYPVILSEANISTPSGIFSTSTNNGILKLKEDESHEIYANFYASQFLNRVLFTNLSSETSENFNWKFGDTETSNEQHPFHIYENSGSFSVELVASNSYISDTIQKEINIPLQSAWQFSGSFYLNQTKRDVKSFVSLEELFSLMQRSAISGDITINTEAGVSFELVLSETTAGYISYIKEKLSNSNSRLKFQREGEALVPTLLEFSGTPNTFYVNALIELIEFVYLENVEILLYGYTFNPKEIEKLKEATLCSETISEAIDFSVIGSSFTYSWEATATPPEISGYQLSGTGTIPAMALSNSSTTRKTLTYTVSVLLSGNTLFQFEYDLIVLPLLPESLNLTSPISNEELTSPSVTFRWSAVNDATYDLYLWESDGIEPSQPIATDIGFTSYSNSTFCQYGKSYAWKIVAKGECNSIESEIALFSIRKLPDLHVTNITSDDIVYTGNQARIIWKVQNDGEGNILPEDWWYDRIWLMPNLGTENPMLNARLLHEKRNKATLETGQYYIDTVTVDIPERISGQFYLVVASDMYDIASIDLSSVGDVLPLPYSPDLSGNPYSYLSAGTSVRTNYNRILEAGENNDQSDNFFYKSISVHVPSLANLQISALEIPDNITETLSHTATATINNVGQSPIQDKTWRDVLYISSQPVFDSQSATLIESKYRDTDLGINEFYSVTFNFVAPVDSLGKYYYFVRTDVDNTVFEENDEDNILRSNEITVLPYWMNEDDYTVLLRFYTETAGQNWKNQWRTASNRIANYWKGVTFEEGRVSELSLENNNLTGELSSGLFELPKLIRLNLYNNNLSGDLDELFSATNLPDSLVSLNLGKNNFGTVIPASISNLAYLEELDLSYNKFNSMENMLPAHIVNLNLKYQDLATKDSIGFTLLPDLSIPEIARYDHINRNFDFHPLYQLELNGNNILALYYNADSYRWSGVTRWEWAYNSGLLFTLQQTSGLLQGSSSSLVLTFEKGDANIDQLVDILDVQHTLNYIFNEHVGPFNKVAGNTYFDASINVQDIVATVNIILDKDESLRSGSEIDQETDLNAPNSIYIENGKLLLKLTEPVAALDISLEGVNENQIRMMLKSSEFQSVCRNTNDGARLIIFSPSNSFIPVGETVLAEMREAGAKIRNAKLSSPEATNVEVDIELKKPTAIPQIGVDDVQVFTNSGFIYFRIPGQSEYISASLSNVQGILLSKQEYHAIEKGLYRMNDMEMPQGVYILTFSVKTPSGIFTKNSKLIISK